MNIDAETGKKIQELQILEQNLQGFSMQKQTLQVELNEILNALSEISKTNDEVYKLVGGIMIKSDKDSLTKELNEKKKILDLRIQAVEKQEKVLDDKSRKLKEDITSSMNSKNSK